MGVFIDPCTDYGFKRIVLRSTLRTEPYTILPVLSWNKGRRAIGIMN